MTRINALTQKFNGGEASPHLDGFIGFDKYPSMCRIMENMIPLAQGPATRRPGTRFVSYLQNSAVRGALIPFEFSIVQAYQIAVGDGNLRFYMNQGSVLEAAKAITGITRANPAVVTIAGHGYVATDDIDISGVVGMTQVNGRRFRVANPTANTFELNDVFGNPIDSSAFTAYASGGTAARVYKIAAPWIQADLFDSDNRLRLKFAQSADVMYLVHPSYAPRKLSRTGHTSWTIETVDFHDGPYLDENTTPTTLVLAATTGSDVTVTITTAITGVNAGAGFKATDVGRLLRIGHAATAWAATTAYAVGDLRYNQGNVYRCVTAGTSAGSGGPSGTGQGIVDGTCQWDFQNAGGLAWGYGKIVTFTDTTHVKIDIVNAFAATGAVASWRLGAWSDTDGWPSAVGFHEERLLFGGAGFNPQRFDGSKTNDFENFAPGAQDDDPLSFAIASDQVNAIRAFASAKDLLILTSGGEFRVMSPNNEPLTPTNVAVRSQTRHGCADMMPETVSNAVLFPQRAGKKIRELAYTLESDGYKAPDMTELADHIAGDGFLDLAYQQEPWSVLWSERADGQLLGMTYLREQNVVPWHRHILGGAFGGGDAVVEAVSTIPGAAGDELWLIVKRTIDGRTVRTVEFMEAPLGHAVAQEDAFYVDCGLTYDGSPTTTLTGLWHLEGQTVKVYGDGAVYPDAVVADGSIAVSPAVSVAQVGLGYRWLIEPMRYEIAAPTGTSQALPKRINQIAVRFYRSLGCNVGRSETEGEYDAIAFRDADDDTGAAPPLFTGDKDLTFEGAWDTDSPLVLFGTDPTPVTVVALMPQLGANDG